MPGPTIGFFHQASICIVMPQAKTYLCVIEVALKLCCSHHLIIHQQPLPSAIALRAPISTFFKNIFELQVARINIHVSTAYPPYQLFNHPGESIPIFNQVAVSINVSSAVTHCAFSY